MTRIPEIKGDTWFNLPEGQTSLSPQDLKNKVVLVDFWTYSCVNCVRTLPHLRKWWEKYKGKDFILLGVHTPEFEFEKDPRNVEEALSDLKVTWPVVMDNDYTIWNAFANKFWPAKYLTNKEGQIVYSHFGEGGYRETEHRIRALIAEKEDHTDLPDFTTDEHSHGNVCFVPTPEAYCGYARGRIANESGYKQNVITNYLKPKAIADGEIALEGQFLADKEHVESKELDSSLYLRFHATEVNLVLKPSINEAKVAIEYKSEDGKKIHEIHGHDVSTLGEAHVTKSRMYNLLRSDSLLDGTLRITARKGNFKAFAFTFSGCEHDDESR